MLERPKLLWFGRPPTEHDIIEAKNRDLIVEVVARGTAPDLRHARAAVFWATPLYFELTAESLETHLTEAINEGLFLHIVVSEEGQRREIARVLEAKLLPGAPNDQHQLRTEPVPYHEGPNRALVHNPGPAANERLEIKLEEDVVLRTDQVLLLQRAFHDCKSIELRRIAGGMSGALTFGVDATLSDSNAGPRPTPFFAKLDTPQKLREEMRRFNVFAEHHVAWHLRPNFVAERRIYGVNQGILVGTFVQPSRSLWEVVLEGDGPRYIRSLFVETLGVLRQETKVLSDGTPPSVVEQLEQFCNYSRVPDARVEAAKSFGGTVHSPRSLWRKLLDLPPKPLRRSAIHGDMHGENVRVRKEDAIVIDFTHATTGPMSADLASLEVWLAFKVPAGRSIDRDQWMRDVEAWYRPEAVDAVWTGSLQTRSTGAVHSCILEIRALAKNSTFSAEEYRKVLAVYLLRHAIFPPEEPLTDEDEFRRTYAYWLANRTVLSIWAADEVQRETA